MHFDAALPYPAGHRAGGTPREERRRCIPRGEGLSSVRSIRYTPGPPAKTCGRFLFRGPAAWRVGPEIFGAVLTTDGGTGKNTNTARWACKALRYILWSMSFPLQPQLRSIAWHEPEKRTHSLACALDGWLRLSLGNCATSDQDALLASYFAGFVSVGIGFRYLSYHARMLFSRSSMCFSSWKPCGSRGYTTSSVSTP